jgi:predicted SnoaL-like aldol condensation-catalyzing enzyme
MALARRGFMQNSSKIRSFLSVAALALTAGLVGFGHNDRSAVAQEATTPLGCSAKQIEDNKALAKLFDMKNDPNVAYQKMSPDYIQHNPIAKRIGEVNNVSGRDEFKLLLELKDKGIGGPPPRLPGQPAEDIYHYVMADCDHLFLLKKIYLPDPQHKGEFYEAFNFDFWRIKDGKLVEHWDDVKIPQNVPPVMTMPISELLKNPSPPPPGPKP